MKRLLLLPCMLFPYVLLFTIYCLYTGFLMEELFGNFILNLALWMLLYFGVAIAFLVIFIVLSIVKKWDYKEISKINMEIKLAQIPAYIAIFILGVLCFITIFTFGFTIFFFIYDIISIIMTGIIGLLSILIYFCKEKRQVTQIILLAIGQFIFCIDIPASIILYKTFKHKDCGNIEA